MSTTPQELPRLLTAEQVSEATGLPRWRVYELSRRGILPTVALGRAYRYSAPAIREFISSGGARAEGET